MGICQKITKFFKTVQDQIFQKSRNIVISGTGDAKSVLIQLDYLSDAMIQIPAALEYSTGKINYNDRLNLAPVPFVMYEKPLKKGFIAFKNFFERTHKQAFAESPGP